MQRNIIYRLCTRRFRFEVNALCSLICFTLASIVYFHEALLLQKDTILRVRGGINGNVMRHGFKNLEYNFETSDEYYRNERNFNGIDCGKFEENDTLEHSQELTLNFSLLSERNQSNTCTALTDGFINSSLTQLEEAFPIAFSVIMHKDAAQAWTLLRAIYRPHNLYCIHIDRSSPRRVWTAMKNLVRCLDNVFLSSRSVDVRWGEFSVLESEIICLQDLYNKSTTWRYFINLTGQEFPLKTNYELVKILTAYDGANDIQGTIFRRRPGRYKLAGHPPDGLNPVKGSVHVVMNRKFAEYVLTEAVAKRLLNWSKNVEVPDEIFFNTLNYNMKLRIPGSFWSENASVIEAKTDMTRYKIWKRYHMPCAGKYSRDICILDVGDLQRMSKSKAMFANKFHWRAGSKVAEYCQSEVIYNRTKEEYFGTTPFNDTYYRNLDFVKFQIK